MSWTTRPVADSRVSTLLNVFDSHGLLIGTMWPGAAKQMLDEMNTYDKLVEFLEELLDSAKNHGGHVTIEASAIAAELRAVGAL